MTEGTHKATGRLLEPEDSRASWRRHGGTDRTRMLPLTALDTAQVHVLSRRPVPGCRRHPTWQSHGGTAGRGWGRGVRGQPGAWACPCVNARPVVVVTQSERAAWALRIKCGDRKSRDRMLKSKKQGEQRMSSRVTFSGCTALFPPA